MDAFLTRFGLDSPLWLGAIAVSIFLISVILSVAFNRLLFPLALKLARFTPAGLASRLLLAVRLPLTYGIVLVGAYLAFTLPLGTVKFNSLGTPLRSNDAPLTTAQGKITVNLASDAVTLCIVPNTGKVRRLGGDVSCA